MIETYYQSAERTTITRKRALAELAAHGCSDAETIAEFDAACGLRATYEAQQVLQFLGY